jgi:hypothetical protein
VAMSTIAAPTSSRAERVIQSTITLQLAEKDGYARRAVPCRIPLIPLPVEAAAPSQGETHMDPRADRRIDEDLRKGAVESELDRWGDPVPDAPRELTGAVALTEDVRSADASEVKHAQDELGADDDGTPG